MPWFGGGQKMVAGRSGQPKADHQRCWPDATSNCAWVTPLYWSPTPFCRVGRRVEAGVAVVADRGALLGFGEVAHLAEHVEPPAIGRRRVDPRVVLGRRRDHGDDHGGLGEAQVTDVLAEVRLGRGADAVGATAEVGRAEVLEHDLLLGGQLRAELVGEIALDSTSPAGPR